MLPVCVSMNVMLAPRVVLIFDARQLEIAPDRVLITGWATDLCVDATVRSAITHHHHVVVVTDCHTVSDRPHLDAVSVIRHHHWIWSDLITQRSVRLAGANELLP